MPPRPKPDPEETAPPSGIVERIYGVTIRAKDEETRSIEVTASSAALDSYDEIVEQDWDLTRYRANPIVL